MAGSFIDIELPDIHIFRVEAREELVSQLESVTGRKDLVLEADLMKPLDRIAGASLLKAHGVDKIFKLEPTKNLPGCNQRMYLVRPSLVTMKYIADQINSEKNSGQQRFYKILMIPRKLHVCEMLLEQEGVYGDVTIAECHIDFFPLDKDVLSLEFPQFFPSFFLEGDQTWCHMVARSLLSIQQIFGLIPNVYGIGSCAKMVHEMTELMFEFEGEPKPLNNHIGHVFLLDRSTDYVTPLCSQVTYEGLLDDIFSIASGFIEFSEEVTGKSQSVKLLLTDQDPIFEEIRNRHFSNVFSLLSGKAKELQVGYDKRHMLSSVKEMKSFVSNDLKGLKQQHKSLSLHIGACEVIVKNKTKGDFEEQLRTEHSLLEGTDTRENISHIEEMICRQVNMTHCLRLLCLLSLTQGGLSTTSYENMQKLFLQSFGFDHLVTFYKLKRLGILTELAKAQTPRQLVKVASVVNIPKSCPFRSLCKKLNLIPKSSEQINLKNPNDMSYVFSGAYTPMLCKLVDQVLTREGFSEIDDIIKLLPGPTFAKVRAKSAKGAGKSSEPQSSRVVLVYILGGCTFSEITALRFLGRLKGYKFLVATTAILNASSLLKVVS